MLLKNIKVQIPENHILGQQLEEIINSNFTKVYSVVIKLI